MINKAEELVLTVSSENKEKQETIEILKRHADKGLYKFIWYILKREADRLKQLEEQEVAVS